MTASRKVPIENHFQRHTSNPRGAIVRKRHTVSARKCFLKEKLVPQCTYVSDWLVFVWVGIMFCSTFGQTCNLWLRIRTPRDQLGVSWPCCVWSGILLWLGGRGSGRVWSASCPGWGRWVRSGGPTRKRRWRKPKLRTFPHQRQQQRPQRHCVKI